jgi:hypothetical protein
MINGLKKAFKKVGRIAAPYIAAGIFALAPGCGGGGGGGGGTHPDSPPVLASISDQVTSANTLYSFNENTDQGTDYDQDGDKVTYQKIAGPSFLSVNPTNGIISGTPSQSDLGPQTVTVQGTDQHSNLSAPVSYNLLVTSQTAQVDLSSPSGEINYAIITNDTLKPNFQTLADWKTRKGVVTKVFSIDDIVANSTYDSARDTPERLRFFLQDLARDNPGLEYVLLGGDVEVVPHRGCYGNAAIEDFAIPTDQYFGDLDDGTSTFDWNYDWDADTDSIFGEVADNVEMTYEVAVGRAPVNTAGEADNFIAKVQAYENMTGLAPASRQGFAKSVLFCAQTMDGTSPGTGIIEKDWINPNIFDFITNGFNLKRLYANLYNGSTELENGPNVWAALQSGYNITNIYGHGYKNEVNVGPGVNDWITCNGSSPYDVRDMTNASRLSILYSLGCLTNAFDNVVAGDCIGEEAINNPNGGFVASIGESREGLYTPGSPLQGISWKYDASFFNSLYTNNIYNIGKALSESKKYYWDVGVPKTDPDFRWVQYGLNLLGDPEMPVWKDYHGILVPVSSGAGYTQVEVTEGINPVNNAGVCIVDGTNLYYATTGADGKVLINKPYNAADKVTATKQDYAPGKVN